MSLQHIVVVLKEHEYELRAQITGINVSGADLAHVASAASVELVRSAWPGRAGDVPHARNPESSTGSDPA